MCVTMLGATGIGSVLLVVLQPESMELLVSRVLLMGHADGAACGMSPSRQKAGLHLSNVLALREVC